MSEIIIPTNYDKAKLGAGIITTDDKKEIERYQYYPANYDLIAHNAYGVRPHFAAWAYAVARGEDIVMKSDGSQIRSYCYCLDSASAILMVLLKQCTCYRENIVNGVDNYWT